MGWKEIVQARQSEGKSATLLYRDETRSCIKTIIFGFRSEHDVLAPTLGPTDDNLGSWWDGGREGLMDGYFICLEFPDDKVEVCRRRPRCCSAFHAQRVETGPGGDDAYHPLLCSPCSYITKARARIDPQGLFPFGACGRAMILS